MHGPAPWPLGPARSAARAFASLKSRFCRSRRSHSCSSEVVCATVFSPARAGITSHPSTPSLDGRLADRAASRPNRSSSRTGASAAVLRRAASGASGAAAAASAAAAAVSAAAEVSPTAAASASLGAGSGTTITVGGGDRAAAAGGERLGDALEETAVRLGDALEETAVRRASKSAAFCSSEAARMWSRAPGPTPQQRRGSSSCSHRDEHPPDEGESCGGDEGQTHRTIAAVAAGTVVDADNLAHVPHIGGDGWPARLAGRYRGAVDREEAGVGPAV